MLKWTTVHGVRHRMEHHSSRNLHAPYFKLFWLQGYGGCVSDPMSASGLLCLEMYWDAVRSTQNHVSFKTYDLFYKQKKTDKIVSSDFRICRVQWICHVWSEPP